MTAPTLPPQQQHQAAQAGLVIVTSNALQPGIAQVDAEDLAATIPQVTDLVQQIAQQYAKTSGALSSLFYNQQRQAAGLTRITVLPAKPPAPEAIQATVEWAASSLYGAEPDHEAFTRDLTLGIGKLVQDTGRQTVISNVHRDRKATGWARIPEPSRSETGTCAFCAMLASRGAVYRSERQAEFDSHDGCKCHAEPLFGAYRASDDVKGWQQLWKDTVSTPGRKGADARAAFRQAIEGRPVTGLTKGPNAPRPAAPQPKVTREQADKLIGQLEAANARATGNRQLARMVRANNARIAALRAA